MSEEKFDKIPKCKILCKYIAKLLLKIFVYCTIIILICGLIYGGYILFSKILSLIFTPYFINKHKTIKFIVYVGILIYIATKKLENVRVQNEEKYKKACDLYHEEKCQEALDILLKISDFSDWVNNFNRDKLITYCYFYLGNDKKGYEYIKRCMEYADDVIKDSPEYYLPYACKGICFDVMNKREEAITNFNKAIELCKKNEKPNRKMMTIIAFCYDNIEQYEQAIKYYSQAYELEKDINIIEEIITCCEKANLHAEGLFYLKQKLEYYENLYKENNKSDEILDNIVHTMVQISDYYYKQKDYSNAMKYYDLILEKSPNNHAIIILKAIKLKEQKCYNAALEIYKSLPVFDSPKEEAYKLNCIGTLYQCLINYEVSIEYFDKAIELNPNETVYILNKASSLFAMCQYDAAIELINGIIDSNCEYKKDVYDLLSNCYLKKNDYDKAIESCNKGLELYINEPDLLYSKATCLLEKAQYDYAITYCEKAIDSGYIELDLIYYTLGMCYFGKKEFDRALNYFNGAINYLHETKDVSKTAIFEGYKNHLAFLYYAKGSCLCELAQNFDEALLSLNQAKEYGYDEIECEARLKEIKNKMEQ